jgi:hypothetical protein
MVCSLPGVSHVKVDTTLGRDEDQQRENDRCRRPVESNFDDPHTALICSSLPGIAVAQTFMGRAVFIAKCPASRTSGFIFLSRIGSPLFPFPRRVFIAVDY